MSGKHAAVSAEAQPAPLPYDADLNGKWQLCFMWVFVRVEVVVFL